MVLYTPLSIDDIYPAPTSKQKMLSYQGKTIIVEETNEQQLQLIQLISTDPNDYLQTNLMPGTVIKSTSIQDDN